MHKKNCGAWRADREPHQDSQPRGKVPARQSPQRKRLRGKSSPTHDVVCRGTARF